MSNETNNKTMSRHEHREQCFSILFEMTFTDDSLQDILDNAVESRTVIADDFTVDLLNSFSDHRTEVDELISKNIRGWTLPRLSRVTLSILRLAVTEMKYAATPDSVAINEAVELAKTYSTSKEAAFVNGVLGSVAKVLKVCENAAE